MDPKTLPLSARGETLELVVCEGSSVRHVALRDKLVTIGRDEGATIQVASMSASRLHARIWRGPPVMLQDVGSVNPTIVNGKKLASGEMIEIKDDAIIVVGDVQILLRYAHKGDKPSVPEQSMERVWKLVELAAPSDLSILVLGETGVGKEVVARKIHALSPRAGQPLLAINCAALHESTLESELFGHEKGAFTGAATAKVGLLEAANGSTVLLDEVGELPASAQAKLLRALDAREIVPLGGIKPRPIDVRVIAVTHRDLATMVDDKTFRADLYFRLDGLTIHVPPLRDRMGELDTLVRELVPKEVSVGPDVISALRAYDWPGNVRELKKVLERAVVLAGGGQGAGQGTGPLRPEHVQFKRSPAGGEPARASAPDLRAEREQAERKAIERALEQADGNQTRAAALLGVSRRTLVERLGRFGIKRGSKT